MTDDTANLILERLNRMDSRLANIESSVSDIKGRLIVIESQLAGVIVGHANSNARVDVLESRIAKIERRLELRD